MGELQQAESWSFALDVTDSDASYALAARVQGEIGELDILVNNAGVIIREGIDSPQAHADIRRVMDVNLSGTFNVIHAWLPALPGAKAGGVRRPGFSR